MQILIRKYGTAIVAIAFDEKGTGIERIRVNTAEMINEQFSCRGTSNLSCNFWGIMNIRKSIYSVFLHCTILELGMNADIANTYKMIAHKDLEPDMVWMYKHVNVKMNRLWMHLYQY